MLVTVEENVLAGGFGSAVLEHLADDDLLGGTRVLRVGLPDRYVTHGKPALLREEVGLTPEARGRAGGAGGAGAERRPGLTRWQLPARQRLVLLQAQRHRRDQPDHALHVGELHQLDR